MDYDVERSERRCAATGREFAPGEEYYSVLVAEGTELKRSDFAMDAWRGPPEGAIAWWKSQMPGRNDSRKRWAPNDLMLDFWSELADRPDKQDMRYVLTLLLVRRRVFRLEDQRLGADDREVLHVYCPRREASYEVAVVPPEAERIEVIQDELAALLQ